MNNELDRASKLPRAKEAQGLLTRMDSQFTVATPQTHSTSLGKKLITENVMHPLKTVSVDANKCMLCLRGSSVTNCCL